MNQRFVLCADFPLRGVIECQHVIGKLALRLGVEVIDFAGGLYDEEGAVPHFSAATGSEVRNFLCQTFLRRSFSALANETLQQ